MKKRYWLPNTPWGLIRSYLLLSGAMPGVIAPNVDRRLTREYTLMLEWTREVGNV